MKYSSKTLALGDVTLSLETGVLAEQATASVLAKLGDTMVLSTVVMGGESKLDYFPLTVDYIERLYAGGRIKGSRWVKREGRPTDDAILTARLIDRSIRPLFPKELKKDIQVVVTVLSVDGQNDPAILALIATSAAISISKIPWNGPIGAVCVGLVGEKGDGKKEFIMNPPSTEAEFIDLDMVVSSTKEKVHMIEAGSRQVTEELVLEGILKAKVWNNKIIHAIEEWVEKVGETKEKVQKDEAFEKIVSLIKKSYKDEIVKLVEGGIDKEVGGELKEMAKRIYDAQDEKTMSPEHIMKAIDYMSKQIIKEQILKENKRPDKRGIREVRPISATVGMLPRTHGSAIFKRGQTQVLTVATLGAPSLEQLIEGPEGEESKRYMHHYSMPPYASGETGRIGTPNRREIGHGALAERALLAVIPPESKFPYTIRVVSEVMSSNGSTSMAATCGSTLSLMDAGVPIEAPVSGIAMGLVSEGTKYVILSDIIGLEDFSGDMDFKVAGTTKGITAVQLDVKIAGLNNEIIEKTLAQAKEGRLHILEKMLSALPQSRQMVSKFAPKIKIVKINPEKIGDVIGSGGRIIKNIIATTNAMVDVDDAGTVTVSSIDQEAVEKAVEWIELLTREIQKGEVFEGKVKRILPFGAMVELVPGKEGLVHVSEMSTQYVDNPSDVVTIGQTVKVRVKEIDDQGRTNLSMLFGEDGKEVRREQPPQRRRENFRGGGQSTFPRKPRFNERRRY